MTLVQQRKSESVLASSLRLARYFAILVALRPVTSFWRRPASCWRRFIRAQPRSGRRPVSRSAAFWCAGCGFGRRSCSGRLRPMRRTEIADATSTSLLVTSSAIAIGNTLEAVVSGYLIGRWSDGRRTFETPSGVAKFALIALAPGAVISATVGVGSLSLAGEADWENFAADLVHLVAWRCGQRTGRGPGRGPVATESFRPGRVGPRCSNRCSRSPVRARSARLAFSPLHGADDPANRAGISCRSAADLGRVAVRCRAIPQRWF